MVVAPCLTVKLHPDWSLVIDLFSVSSFLMKNSAIQNTQIIHYSSITPARRKHQLLSQNAAVLLLGCQVPVQLLRQGQILGPGGLPQGVLERAMLEEMLTGHWGRSSGRVVFRRVSWSGQSLGLSGPRTASPSGADPRARWSSAGCPGAGNAGSDAHWSLERCCRDTLPTVLSLSC